MDSFKLIIGFSNSGKTSYSEQFDNVFHLDQGFSVQDMPQKGDIVVEGVYLRQRMRKKILDAINKEKYEKICIWFDTPIEVCIEREHEGRKRPDALLYSQSISFQPPTYDEGWDKIIVIRDNETIELNKSDQEV